MPPFTREAQEWIWHRQNPPRDACRTSKYLFVDNIVQQVSLSHHAAAPHSLSTPKTIRRLGHDDEPPLPSRYRHALPLRRHPAHTLPPAGTASHVIALTIGPVTRRATCAPVRTHWISVDS